MTVQRQNSLVGWLMVIPTLSLVGFFVVGALGYVFYLSFFRWNLIDAHPVFVGLHNYISMLQDSGFRHAVLRTMIYMLGTTGVTLPLALLLALFLNRPMRGVHLLRSIIFIPYIIPAVSAAIAWAWLLEPHFGLVNFLLRQMGLPPYSWLSSSNSALISIILIYAWQFTGYFALLFLSGLQNIPEALYEAVEVDGGTAWAKFLHVTLPLLSPTIFFNIMMSVIFSCQSFDQIYVLTGGGPADSTTTVLYYLFRQGFQFFHIGNAAAISILMFIFLFAITYLQFWGAEKWVHHQM
jgi:ABC-type sugar transport system permease subunit